MIFNHDNQSINSLRFTFPLTIQQIVQSSSSFVLLYLRPNVLTSASQISQAGVKEWNVVVCGWMLREQI